MSDTYQLADKTAPAPPDRMTAPTAKILGPGNGLLSGCYLIELTENDGGATRVLDGVLRLMRSKKQGVEVLEASGDLYERVVKPRPSDGIPVLQLGVNCGEWSGHVYYVRVTGWQDPKDRLVMEFELHPFDYARWSWSEARPVRARLRWQVDGPQAANIKWPPDAWSNGILTGPVTAQSGQPGDGIDRTMTIRKVSRFAREASVQVDWLSGIESPDGQLDNLKTMRLANVFRRGNLKLTVSAGAGHALNNAPWNMSELHSVMEQWRNPVAKDAWSYWLLCADRLEDGLFGVMFDLKDPRPREGAAVAAGMLFPDEPKYGQAQGETLGEVPKAYFRTAAHEIGHMMGLTHSTTGRQIMRQTGGVVDATPFGTFPEKIVLTLGDQDVAKLRHWPDPFIRPGLVPFDWEAGSMEDTSLTLEVLPLEPVLPFGAPLRLHFRLTNNGTKAIAVPDSQRWDSWQFWGTAERDGADGTRPFSSTLSCVEGGPVRKLSPGETVMGDATLLRGARGAILPAPGLHKVRFGITFGTLSGRPLIVEEHDSPAITVRGAPDQAAQDEARALISSSEVGLLIALNGGDHLVQGVQLLQDAVTLRPHYLAIEVLRLGHKFFDRGPDFQRVAALLAEDVVMTTTEVLKVGRFVRDRREAGAVTPAENAVLVEIRDLLAAKLDILRLAGFSSPAQADRLVELTKDV